MGFFKIWAKNFASPFISTSIIPHILGSSYIYIHASIDCQIVTYMHRSMDPLILAYINPQVHGSLYLCISTTTDPQILWSLQKVTKKVPQICYCLGLRSAILDKGWHMTFPHEFDIWQPKTVQKQPIVCRWSLLPLHRSSYIYPHRSMDPLIFIFLHP